MVCGLQRVVLTQMMAYDPAKRPTATDALLGAYLNHDCSQLMGKKPPPIPWSLTSHLETAVLLSQHARNGEECVISDAHFTYKVDDVSIQNAVSLFHQDDQQDSQKKKEQTSNGVKVTAKSKLNNDIQLGDELLEIGPIDVEEFDRKHVIAILQAWPRPTASLLFRHQ